MRFVPLLCVALAACASGTAGSTPPPASETFRVLSATGTASATMNASDGVMTRTVAAAPDQVWKTLPYVLDSLGIPVNILEAGRRTIGNSGFNVRGRLKGVALSRYIDCGGATQMGPNADSYSVNLQFLIEVKPADAGSSIVTTMQAMAKPITYAQDYSACSSKGVLEAKVSELVAAKLSH